jgi:hypothetical protein
MTSEEEAYFNMMEDLFSHPGWKHLMDEARARIYQLQADSLDLYSNWDEVCEARGRARELAELVRLQEIMETIRHQKEDADASV